MFKFSNPIKTEELEAAYKEGLPRIDQLEDGVVYEGRCRNASKAIWNKQLGKFIYVRQKFGSRFLESINHPANDDGFDLFLTKGVVTSFEDQDKEVYERDIKDFLG
jgi:hypothetical protein